MKKKLEAELISIAHRILKLKNRAELDQLRDETLKLYEKLSVLRFVEDNFADVKPTIGYASAEGKLEEVYGMEELPHVHANEVEAAEAKAREEKKKSPPTPEGGELEKNDKKEDKENESGEGVTAGKEEAPAAEKEKEETEKPEQGIPVAAKEEAPALEAKQEEKKEEAPEPEQEVEVVKPEAEIKAMEEGAVAVFEKEDKSTEKEEEEAADAEVITIAPDTSAKTEDTGTNIEFAFERKPAPETPQKQKEITFEDYHDYKEPEFVKKGDEKKEEPKPVAEEAKKEEQKADDWRNWEPSKPAEEEKPKQEEPKQPEPAAEEKPADDWRTWEPKKDPQPETPAPTPIATPVAPRPVNDAFGKTINLALNDRIAFEKNLFGGSSEDLNRVVSQINTQNSFDEAKAFIEDLVKPDYNNWSGKEEYEARFMELVEKRFS
ncbi:hypothetical protein HYN59_03225 [Flavobacterium album]|uniref:Uncharacterized protein n=1 Tax=Flavobacterium album TaxID=2175091 RepID=A0A2S1QUW8_9FLAO|nr:hypothetical protein [Flavobacterium album]AWH84185.1 hypothetical protein HYN59_03225 [Flavobacterium album]